MAFVARFDGMVDDILNLAVKAGYFKTKAEVLRAGVLWVGKEYHLIEDLRDLRHAEEIDAGIKSGKIKLHSEAEWKKLVEKKKRE